MSLMHLARRGVAGLATFLPGEVSVIHPVLS
jgi:hypothetical protein